MSRSPTLCRYWETITYFKWHKQGSLSSFRPLTGWVLHRFFWKSQRGQLKGIPIECYQIQPTSFLIGQYTINICVGCVANILPVQRPGRDGRRCWRPTRPRRTSYFWTSLQTALLSHHKTDTCIPGILDYDIRLCPLLPIDNVKTRLQYNVCTQQYFRRAGIDFILRFFFLSYNRFIILP